MDDRDALGEDETADAQRLRVDADRIDPDGRLAGALGRDPTQAELLLWAAMPGERRSKALSRISILRRWAEHPGEMTAAEAAGEANLAVSRWYEVAASWKASPTLSSVGSFAKRPGRRGQRLDGDAVNHIQAILPGLVRDAGDVKVGTLVTRLQENAHLDGMKLPHVNTLRTMVERERRRLKAEAKVGGRPGLDVAAVDLPRGDGTYHTLFTVVDRTSRLILGFAVGDLADSRAAYARAARSALAFVTGSGSAMLPWADATERVDVIVGDDAEAWATVAADYARTGIGPAFGLVTSERRYGRYLKLAAGSRLGSLSLRPARTGTTTLGAADLSYSDDEATVAIEVEVRYHNADVLAQSVAVGSPRPAPETIDLLRFLADL